MYGSEILSLPVSNRPAWRTVTSLSVDEVMVKSYQPRLDDVSRVTVSAALDFKERSVDFFWYLSSDSFSFKVWLLRFFTVTFNLSEILFPAFTGWQVTSTARSELPLNSRKNPFGP